MAYGFYEATRDRDWLRDEADKARQEAEQARRRNAALLERVTVLERALEWIAEHETDEGAIAERTVCDHDFHTTRPPMPTPRCPRCCSRWWATDGSFPSVEGSYALGAVAQEALDG